MSKYPTFLICTVYTIFYTIYCILPMPHGHCSSITLFVYILIHPFTIVYKVVVVNLLDFLLDITALSELEPQAFRYTANHVYVTNEI